MKITHKPSNNNPDDLEQRAEQLRLEREQLLDRARELRSERYRRPIALSVLAEQIGLKSDRPLIDAARRGDLEASRIGGTERGELVTTLEKLEAYLEKRPAKTKTKAIADVSFGTSSEDEYDAIVAKRSA